MNRPPEPGTAQACSATENIAGQMKAGRRLPWLVRRHIDSCVHCQTAVLLHVDFCNTAMGRQSKQLKRRWNGSVGRKPGFGFLWNQMGKIVNVAGIPLHALFLLIVVVVTLSAIYRCNP